MPDSTGFGDYTEPAVIPVRFTDKDGTVQEGGYVHAMYLDDNSPIAGGREFWGSEEAANSQVCHGERTCSARCTTARCSAHRHHWLQAPRARSGAAAQELAKPASMIKIIPHVDCTPRICELVRYYLEDVTVKGAWVGPAAAVLRPRHVRRQPPAGGARSCRPATSSLT